MDEDNKPGISTINPDSRIAQEARINLRENPMLAVEPTAIHSTVPLTTQILEWVNGFTLPAIIATVWGATRWLTKKEDEFRAGLEAAKAELETIKTNHLHHIQESLNEIKNAQVETTKEMASQTKEMVQATNQSKDAIVNAIISMK